MNVIELDLHMDNQQPGSFEELVKTVRPDWKEYPIKTLKLSGGYLNSPYKCYPDIHGKNLPPDDAIVVRINGNISDSKLVDRERELRNLHLLSRKGVGLKLLATFTNGIVYRFAVGQCLDRAVRDWTVLRAVAKEMAVHHQITYKELEADGNIQLWSQDRIPNQFKYIQFHIDMYPSGYEDKEKDKRFKENLPRKDEIQGELDQLQRHLEALNIPLVMCHNDVWGQNMVYDQNAGTVNFIDYEDSGFSYAALDMAYFFCTTVGFPGDFSKLPSKTEIQTFLDIYLDKKASLQPELVIKVEEEREVLYTQICKGILVKLLQCCSARLVYDRLYPGTLDYLGFAIDSYKEYVMRKEPYLKL